MTTPCTICSTSVTSTPFAANHGVMGDEFDTVLVVLDDSGAAWTFHSFDKYLYGADETAKPECAQRSRNVSCVCCSMARQKLVVIDLAGACAAKTERKRAPFGIDRCYEV